MCMRDRGRARRVARKRASFHAGTIKRSLFSGISHPLDRRKELKMAVIAVGSRPETPDVTKFFELPAVDRRFEGMAIGAGRQGADGRASYIRNSYLRWG